MATERVPEPLITRGTVGTCTCNLLCPSFADDMKVMKVVFATVGAGQTTPVYSEIISVSGGLL